MHMNLLIDANFSWKMKLDMRAWILMREAWKRIENRSVSKLARKYVFEINFDMQYA